MDASSIQKWLIERVAEETEQSPDKIDPLLPFSTIGLDSAAALALTGDLEDLLNISIDPTVIFEYPNINKLADYLAHHAA